MLVLDPTKLIDKIIEFLAFFLVDIPGKVLTTSLDAGLIFTLWEKFFGSAAVIQAMFILALSIGIFTAYTKHNVLRGGHQSGGKM